ncbi:MAG TPA: NAD-dependent epimerase/dehydratase family protein [Polyangiaceae bacterium]|jgi:dTDP-L-rhamnose 4-epimerase|nr:NAD-dependent epimerase/dehydratase family protein [Polyangiaceae bacterium]
MSNLVLITGGAGFIGSHVADELLKQGYHVRALDNLSPQVHGPGATRPAYLDSRVELQVGDVRHPAAVARALDGVGAVIHLAAAVGVGQSMYRMRSYIEVNGVGTATLLDQLAKRSVRRLVVASSMSIYGEGRYRAADGTEFDRVSRSVSDLKAGIWDPRGADGAPLEPVPTPEDKSPLLNSVYALSKYDQERMCLMFGSAYGVPTVALRLFNTYGPRQSLSNPYTGVLAIFAARLLNGRPPVVFEDGRQRRDFVNVRDVARAFALALTSEAAVGHAMNIGSGASLTILDVARRLAQVLRLPQTSAEIAGQYRVGDIRHCFADTTLARELLGYEPSVSLEAGLGELGEWLRRAKAEDSYDVARRELEIRGLTLG